MPSSPEVDDVGWVTFRTVAALPQDDSLLAGRVAAVPADAPAVLVRCAPPGEVLPGEDLGPGAVLTAADLLVVPDAPPLLRCAWCHDDLGAAAVACPRCDTRLHPECVVERRCPTLGCGHPFLPGGGPAPAPRRPGVPWLRLVTGAVAPLACFGVNEAARPLHALAGGLYGPELHRPLYPLLLWAIAALVAGSIGRRAPWIRWGLRTGVLLAGLFSLLYVPVLPLAIVGLVVGIGALGFGPFAAFGAFVAAQRAYAADDRRAEVGALAARIVVRVRA